MKFTSEQFYRMCDCHMSDPVRLEDAFIERPFVYDRKYGLFYVSMGYHRAAMSLLLAFRQGSINAIETSHKMNLRYSEDTSDYWLRMYKGTAFRSSVGHSIETWDIHSLNDKECQFFESVRYIKR